jgi:hypothetical protein
VIEKSIDELRKDSLILKKAAEILGVEDKDLPRVIDRFAREIAEMKKSS